MTALSELQQKQIQQAEELLFSGPQSAGFAKELFFGRFLGSAILPYPQLAAAEQAASDAAVAELREYCNTSIDAVAIDRDCEIPRSVILGLGKIGVLGAAVRKEYGGRGLNQQQYCRQMEVIGGHCASTAVFVNAHHSIGLRALELFGTPEQRSRWMPPLTTGESLAAFALTEPEAGSDASNVRTQAVPAGDRPGYLLTGEKRYITNGGIADVLTVMARTPDSSDPDGKITAFLVTPDMPGFEVLEARMPKCGIRGTATGRMRFTDMYVPQENVLGKVGKGLRLALTVLDFGRTTFGACCTGAAKFCVEKGLQHARKRKQFGRPLGGFELVQHKLAEAAADTFAMESATYHTAALIDRDAEDFMVETAMLKVFASDTLWRIVNDVLQIYGGAGYFCDEPLERMMRDARINLIGEGANDVLRCFVAMVGLRGVGKELESLLRKPWRVASVMRHPAPAIPVPHPRLQPAAARLSKQISKLATVGQWALIRHREGILEQQGIQARIGDIATELYMASCVYSRLTTLLKSSNGDAATMRDLRVGLLSLKLATSRNAERFRQLADNDDVERRELAKMLLEPNAGH